MGISTHILDTALGRPAKGVLVVLTQWETGDWMLVHSAATGADGRVKHLLPEGRVLEAGLYRARFDTAAYFEAKELLGFYPFIDIVFEVRDAEQHYHVPLLLTANGYTTYRGS